MKCLYVFQLEYPEDGFHVTDPAEARHITEQIDSGEFNAYYGWDYKWVEL